MTILFIGTGEIGIPVLRWLITESGHQIAGVVCQPDKPSGRKQLLTPPATKALAVAAGIPVFQPERINDPAALDVLLAAQPDLIVVMAYGQFLPARLRNGARLGCINLHASLLPRWRGASPIQSALAAGDPESGITVMYVVREMDAGDILLAEATSIRPDDTAQSLQDRLAQLAPQALARALTLLAQGTAPRIPQSPDLVTRCAKLGRHLGDLDWSRPADEIERLIRAYDPWPGTHTFLPASHGRRLLKVFPPVSVTPLPPPSAPGPPPHPGELVSVTRDALTVATGSHAISLNSLQAEGQKRLSTRDFLAGTRLKIGQRFGSA